MSDTTPGTERDDTDEPRLEDAPTEEVPAAAGGHDDSAPEQGEGQQDSH
ncbi:hypothetical protein [Mobilicoccus caccae]|uniref:Uncharacterized protein n=1 Tax=Mobilicoccus caccae TaxID=1859295 RepID=A0ABQ6IV58_9MICO|nr:hypothetical protein [Mobilicoccus caccae]GMA41829.1 hypothetical protein GCM10025883_38740 [Mobilicoccus caccae]